MGAEISLRSRGDSSPGRRGRGSADGWGKNRVSRTGSVWKRPGLNTVDTWVRRGRGKPGFRGENLAVDWVRGRSSVGGRGPGH